MLKGKADKSLVKKLLGDFCCIMVLSSFRPTRLEPAMPLLAELGAKTYPIVTRVVKRKAENFIFLLLQIINFFFILNCNEGSKVWISSRIC